MNLRKMLLILSSALAAACLLAGIGFGRWWLGLAVAVVLAGSLVVGARRVNWLPSACLAGYIAAAAAGMLTGGSPPWLLYGALAALVSWDLILFSVEIVGAELAILARRRETEHLKALDAAAGIGLAVITAGLNLRSSIPFALMLAAAVAALAGLLLAWRLLQRNHGAKS